MRAVQCPKGGPYKKLALAVVAALAALPALAQHVALRNAVVFSSSAPSLTAGQCTVDQSPAWLVSGTGNIYYCTGTNPTATYTLASALVQTTNTAVAVVAKCGNVSMDPASTASNATGTATATVTGLAANDVCVCTPRTDFNDDVLLKGCYGTTNTLNLRFYVASGGANPTDAAAQTVDYCCFAK